MQDNRAPYFPPMGRYGAARACPLAYGEQLPEGYFGGEYLVLPVFVTIPVNGQQPWQYRFPSGRDWGLQVTAIFLKVMTLARVPVADGGGVRISPESIRIGSTETLQAGRGPLPIIGLGGQYSLADDIYYPHWLSTPLIIPPGGTFSFSLDDTSGNGRIVSGYIEGRVITGYPPKNELLNRNPPIVRGEWFIGTEQTILAGPVGSQASVEFVTASGESGYAIQDVLLNVLAGADELADVDINQIRSIQPDGTHILGDNVNNVQQSLRLPADVWGGMPSSGKRHTFPTEIIVRPSQRFDVSFSRRVAGADLTIGAVYNGQWLVPADQRIVPYAGQQ